LSTLTYCKAYEEELEQVEGEAEGPLPIATLPPSCKSGDWSLYGYYAAVAGSISTLVYLIQVVALAVFYNFSREF
jgi:hypothetical protein